MQFAICDDMYEEIEIIEQSLAARGHEVDVYSSGEAMLCACQEENLRYDAAFIDMEMQGLNGFETANALRALDDRILVSFVTSHHDYVKECFDCDPVWFIDKPVEMDCLERAIKKTEQLYAKRGRTYTFRDSDGIIALRSDDILYFETQGHNLIIHTKIGSRYTFRKSMKALTQELGREFCRVHDSFMVNLQYVTYLGSEEITENSPQGLKKRKTGRTIITLAHCKTLIPVGRAYKKDAQAAIVRFQQERYTR